MTEIHSVAPIILKFADWGYGILPESKLIYELSVLVDTLKLLFDEILGHLNNVKIKIHGSVVQKILGIVDTFNDIDIVISFPHLDEKYVFTIIKNYFRDIDRLTTRTLNDFNIKFKIVDFLISGEHDFLLKLEITGGIVESLYKIDISTPNKFLSSDDFSLNMLCIKYTYNFSSGTIKLKKRDISMIYQFIEEKPIQCLQMLNFCNTLSAIDLAIIFARVIKFILKGGNVHGFNRYEITNFCPICMTDEDDILIEVEKLMRRTSVQMTCELTYANHNMCMLCFLKFHEHNIKNNTYNCHICRSPFSIRSSIYQEDIFLYKFDIVSNIIKFKRFREDSQYVDDSYISIIEKFEKKKKEIAELKTRFTSSLGSKSLVTHVIEVAKLDKPLDRRYKSIINRYQFREYPSS